LLFVQCPCSIMWFYVIVIMCCIFLYCQFYLCMYNNINNSRSYLVSLFSPLAFFTIGQK